MSNTQAYMLVERTEDVIASCIARGGYSELIDLARQLAVLAKQQASPAALTDEQIITRCEAAGMKWLPPFDDPDEEGGFKGAFDLSDIDSLRKLLSLKA